MGERKERNDAWFKTIHVLHYAGWYFFEVLEVGTLGRKEENSISVSIRCFKDAL